MDWLARRTERGKVVAAAEAERARRAREAEDHDECRAAAPQRVEKRLSALHAMEEERARRVSRPPSAIRALDGSWIEVSKALHVDRNPAPRPAKALRPWVFVLAGVAAALGVACADGFGP